MNLNKKCGKKLKQGTYSRGQSTAEKRLNTGENTKSQGMGSSATNDREVTGQEGKRVTRGEYVLPWGVLTDWRC